MISPYKQRKVKGRRIDEHRLLVEQHLGRRLGRLEYVHHINGDKRDNRLENLEIVTPKEHSAKHGRWKHPVTKVCPVCEKTFTPHPTKRARARTCGKRCGLLFLSIVNRDAEKPCSGYRDDTFPSRKMLRKQVPSGAVLRVLAAISKTQNIGSN